MNPGHHTSFNHMAAAAIPLGVRGLNVPVVCKIPENPALAGPPGLSSLLRRIPGSATSIEQSSFLSLPCDPRSLSISRTGLQSP